MSGLEELFDISKTDITTTIHRESYPAISPSKPELSQAGRVVLIPGGGTGVGFATARSFVRASAKTIIILGRRAHVLAEAASRLEEETQAVGTSTQIITYPCDVVNMAEVDAFWKEIGARGITIDVFVANVAKITEPKPLLELGVDEVWSQIETNVKSPLYFSEKFYSQPGEKQKVIIHSFTVILYPLTWSLLVSLTVVPLSSSSMYQLDQSMVQLILL